ncbi:MAG: hypothetical protein ACOCVZ_04025 [Gemmatimonadota bacterium]
MSRVGDEDRLGVATRRGRGAVAASILAVLLMGGYFAASIGELAALPPGYLISAAVLVAAFWFPAMRLGSPAELKASLFPLVAWLLAWTLVWDLAISGILGDRQFFQEWWIVYPAGVVFFLALLALHAAVVQRVERR